MLSVKRPLHNRKKCYYTKRCFDPRKTDIFGDIQSFWTSENGSAIYSGAVPEMMLFSAEKFETSPDFKETSAVLTPEQLCTLAISAKFSEYIIDENDQKGYSGTISTRVSKTNTYRNSVAKIIMSYFFKYTTIQS